MATNRQERKTRKDESMRQEPTVTVQISWDVTCCAIAQVFPMFGRIILTSHSLSRGLVLICLVLNTKELWSFKMPGTTHPTTQCSIP